MKNFISGFLVMLLLVGLTTAQITINKTAPEEIRIDEILKVGIEIWNGYNEDISVVLKESINFGEPLDKEFLVQAQEIVESEGETIVDGVRWLNPDGKCEIGCIEGDGICDPDCGCTFREDSDCASFIIPATPRYEWTFILGAKAKKKIVYRVKPSKLGEIKISPTKAETIKGTFYSNSCIIKVKCNADGICEGKENFQNCPEDCQSGGKDDYCDRVLDGRCDPDCLKEADPDCIPARCGDNICEGEKGENYENCPYDCERPLICGDNFCGEKENYGNCPQDCPSGSSDGYCDGLADNKCDLDCQRKLDSDCFCNKDRICELELENFKNCPEDCQSGGKDNYCDGKEDGKCDPDCQPEEDPDCGKKSHSLVIIAIIAIIVLFVIYRKLRKHKHEG